MSHSQNTVKISLTMTIKWCIFTAANQHICNETQKRAVWSIFSKCFVDLVAVSPLFHKVKFILKNLYRFSFYSDFYFLISVI